MNEHPQTPPPAAPASQEKKVKTGGSEEKKISPMTRGTILMLVMFVTGLGYVYMEGRKAKFTPAEDSNQQKVKNSMLLIDINCKTGEDRKQEVDKMIKPLTYEPENRQITVSELKINPFKDYLYRKAETQKADEPVETEEEKAKRLAEEERKRKLAEKAREKAPPVDKLELQSIISGTNPSAMISKRLVYEGQMIHGWRVEKIYPKKVTLRWRDRRCTLRMKTNKK